MERQRAKTTWKSFAVWVLIGGAFGVGAGCNHQTQIDVLGIVIQPQDSPPFFWKDMPASGPTAYLSVSSPRYLSSLELVNLAKGFPTEFEADFPDGKLNFFVNTAHATSDGNPNRSFYGYAITKFEVSGSVNPGSVGVLKAINDPNHQWHIKNASVTIPQGAVLK